MSTCIRDVGPDGGVLLPRGPGVVVAAVDKRVISVPRREAVAKPDVLIGPKS